MQRDTRDVGTEERPREDAMKRWLPVSPGERPQNEANAAGTLTWDF